MSTKEEIVGELGHIVEKEFRELDEEEQWNMIRQASKIIRDYRIQADKNCELCKDHLQMNYNDINIDLLFEDWRNCSEVCDECNKETKRLMCQLQFDIINHLAQEIFEMGSKINNITELIMKSDVGGSELIKSLKENIDKAKEARDRSQDMYG